MRYFKKYNSNNSGSGSLGFVYYVDTTTCTFNLTDCVSVIYTENINKDLCNMIEGTDKDYSVNVDDWIRDNHEQLLVDYCTKKRTIEERDGFGGCHCIARPF